ncbi:hypothetical protein HPB52_005139 [Rhipicephalus sanguineus]|uniref:Tick transposon n=1 Tax=Rhipicephalus sanguineus TaxID=34632 RepID=A0A9D4Q4W4_RHISA|nr:hypothetical protein HPB52_005139 [Rhipicephalus sanguineus]
MSLFTFATWNVRGFRDKAKQRDILAFAQAHGIDILFIQETNFRSPLDVSSFRREFQAFCTFGVNGRTLLLDLFINGKRCRFVNVYAPAKRADTNPFFQALRAYLSEPLPHVILGDFNCVIDSQRDVRGPGRGGSTYHARELRKVLTHFSLTDAWLHTRGDIFVPTRTSQLSASRLDRTYLPDFLLPSVVACEVLSPPADLASRSDHLPLATTLSGSPGASRSDQSWRLDAALLQDEESVERIRKRLRASVATAPGMTPRTWDALKVEWKAILQEEGRERKRRITARINETLRRIRIVKGAETLTLCMQNYLITLEAEYIRLLQQRAARPPGGWGKAPNQADEYLNEVCGNGSVRITRVKRPDGSLATDPDEITEIFRDHFAAVFRSAEPDGGPGDMRSTEEVCRNLVRLSEEEVALLDSEVPAEEFPHETLGDLEIVDVVKVLGIYFCCGGVAETTWKRAIERARAAIARLSFKDLTLREKAVAAKTTICAFAYYASRIAVMPTKTALQVTKMLGSFLWEGKPAPVRRTLLQLPESEGGLGLTHALTISKVLALKTARALFRSSDYVGRCLMRYWSSTSAAFLDADRPLGPLAETPSPFYKAAANTMRMLQREAPDCDVDEVPPARIAEEVARHQISDEERQMSRKWKKKASKDGRGTPRLAQDFAWRKNWEVLPTRQRLHKFGIVPSPRCPNCRADETLAHALMECPAAKPVWRLVARDFKIRPPPALNRNRGAFAKLVVMCTWFSIWKRRCLAEARRKPTRAAYPTLSRVREMIWRHLSEQLESSGEEKFLRRWHTRFFLMRQGKLQIPITAF